VVDFRALSLTLQGSSRAPGDLSLYLGSTTVRLTMLYVAGDNYDLIEIEALLNFSDEDSRAPLQVLEEQKTKKVVDATCKTDKHCYRHRVT